MRAKRKKIYALLMWLVVIMHASVIFYFSSQAAYQSNALSKSIAAYLTDELNLPKSININGTVYNLNYNEILRKLAHFGLYFFLALLIYAALKLIRIKSSFAMLLSFLFCTIYSLIDESHQIMVSGRSAQLSDAMIDMSAAGLMVLLIFSFHKLRKNKLFKN